MKTSRTRLFLLAVLTCVLSVFARAADAGRERLRFDAGWRFHLGNEWGLGQNLAKAATGYGPASTAFSDASWRRVDLPHDWAIELPFDRKADTSHGFKALGETFPQNSVAWYRRTFTLPATDAGRRIWIEFDGVYRDSTVFVNGWCLGREESGYSNFRYDITDVANVGGENVVAVRVDATHTEGWFYEGAGIYRHVWLVKTGPVAIAPDGIFVHAQFAGAPEVTPADVQTETELNNQHTGDADVTVNWTVLDPSGNRVGTAQQDVRVGLRGSATAKGSIHVASPQLWSPETPRLYRLVTTVQRGGATIDRQETEFGLRTVGFDPEKGFLLNGKPYVLKGTCNHQDHAGVGAALPDAVQYFRIARLKEMGGNAYRTSHNPPTPELLEACDRLGMLVMDENRLLGSDPTRIDRWVRLIRRDRNHASVAIWSIANEEFTAGPTPAGARVGATMQALVKSMDPTRPVTYAAPVGNEFTGINGIIEVRGWNYHVGPDMDAYHAAHPQQPNVGTEQGSTVGTRGIYANDPVRGYVSAYDDNGQSWSNTAKQWWGFFATRPWLSGGFVWTGFDYRGEPTPYTWPCINSHFGIFDTCGFPKDNFWNYKAWWTAEPVLHLTPHWNWAGREKTPIDVRALSNCDEVELFLNGASLGKKTMAPASELRWSVPYEAGVLSAKGYREGKQVAETKVETTGAPAGVRLEADREAIAADGEDLSIIAISVVDAAGRVVPTASDEITFEVAGPARFAGVGNGDPSSHEADQFIVAPTLRTQPVDGWRFKKGIDPYAREVPDAAAAVDIAAWNSVNVNAEDAPVHNGERAVFRGRVTLTQTDLDAPGAELWFGKIKGGVSIYVNGQRVGEVGGDKTESIFDVKSALKVGENTIAVTIASYGDDSGLMKGVALRFAEMPAAPVWKRSAFNGYAQLILRAEKKPGDIVVTARGTNLTPAKITIHAQSAKLRPAVE
jgi:beta-galactosidase